MLADLPPSWTMLRSRRIGGPDGPDVPFLLVHPEFGVALVDLVPAASAAAAFQAFLARERFASFYPGHLPVVAVGIGPTEIPAAGDKLADAFEAADPLTIADRDWADAVIELLLTPDARGAEEAPAPRAVVPPPPPPSPIVEPRVEAAPVRHTAAGRTAPAAPASRRRWPAIALTALLLAIVAAVAIAAASRLLDEQGPATATSVPLPPAVRATVSVPPSVATATAPDTAAPASVAPPPLAPPPLPPMPVVAALSMIAPPAAPFAPSRVAPLPPPPAPVTAGLAMIPPPASPLALSRVPPLPLPPALPAKKPPVDAAASARPPSAEAQAKPRGNTHEARRAPARTVARAVPPPAEDQTSRRVHRQPERRDLPPIDASDLPPLDGPVAPPPSMQAAITPSAAPPPQQRAASSVPPPAPRADERPREAPTAGMPAPLLPPAVSGSSSSPRPAAEPSPVVAASGGNSQSCRPYRSDATVTGLPEPVRGLACRDMDGHWQIVSEVPDR